MMEIFGTKFALLNVSLKRRLETLAVAVYFSVFLFVVFTGYFGKYVIGIYCIIYTKILRYIVLLYVIWMYYDNNMHYDDLMHVGDKRARIRQWLRTCTFKRFICNYFPIKLVKTTDLDPNKSYLFCNFPHGITCTGIWFAFGTDIIGYHQLFPGIEIRIIILNRHWTTPIFREYIRVTYSVDSNAESMNRILSMKPKAPYTGRASVLMPGGAAEMMESKPGTYRVVTHRRKGFVRIALRNGVPIVPVCSFGETDIYDTVIFPEGSLMKKIVIFIRKIIGIPPMILIGWGFFQNYFGIIPRRTPITVVDVCDNLI
ncbi:2-acylglycerol O-acyltransferase 2-A-like [Frieseomelitta varia]|uniref:2-acylglycerol O-acyltransferase 2-A-like n=1 Tax=Frieseomelitta varia TaxID=561572 RepID=UPI001CB687B2|nr:2-acylglycerol O-acyltransferase 2-A-like [Frieseomelitta varia]